MFPCFLASFYQKTKSDSGFTLMTNENFNTICSRNFGGKYVFPQIFTDEGNLVNYRSTDDFVGILGLSSPSPCRQSQWSSSLCSHFLKKLS